MGPERPRPYKFDRPAWVRHGGRAVPSLLRRCWLLVGLSAGCASSPPPEPEAPPSVPAPVATAEPVAGPKRPVPPGQLRREDVLAVLSEGPPAFLQKIDVEPAVDGAGHFVGWRVMAVRDPVLASGDVKAGDVIRKVNGQSIERPFQFFDVFQSLAFAPVLSLAIERGNEQRELTYPISEDPSAAPLPHADRPVGAATNDAAPAPDTAKKAKRGKTKR